MLGHTNATHRIMFVLVQINPARVICISYNEGTARVKLLEKVRRSGVDERDHGSLYEKPQESMGANSEVNDKLEISQGGGRL